MNCTPKQIDILLHSWNILQQATNVVISTHVDPDGDALGSSLGLYHLLQHYGIHATIINHSNSPRNLQFLPESNAAIIHADNPNVHHILSHADVYCVLDLNTSSRLGSSVAPLFQAFTGTSILFDHHVEPTINASIINSIIPASSTCEIIAVMAREAGLTVSQNAATCLYTGIMTDTGGFRHPRTNAEVMRLAAWLMECGANPVMIYDKVMNANSPESIVLLGRALSSIRFSEDSSIALIVLDDKQLEGYIPEDTEGFVNYTLSIYGVKIGGLITQWKDGLIKISMRSKPEYEVRSIAEAFGGGGHLQAAGARTVGESLAHIVEKVFSLAHQSMQ